MSLTETQKLLVRYLKSLNLDSEKIIGTMLFLPKEEQLEKLGEFLVENPQATEDQILEKVLELSE